MKEQSTLGEKKEGETQSGLRMAGNLILPINYSLQEPKQEMVIKRCLMTAQRKELEQKPGNKGGGIRRVHLNTVQLVTEVCWAVLAHRGAGSCVTEHCTGQKHEAKPSMRTPSFLIDMLKDLDYIVFMGYLFDMMQKFAFH